LKTLCLFHEWIDAGYTRPSSCDRAREFAQTSVQGLAHLRPSR